LIILLSFLAMFLSTFLSGFRSRSIALGQKWQASITGALQTGGELVVVTMIAKSSDWWIVLWSCVAAGLGYFLSMRVHDIVNKSYFERTRKLKRKEQKLLIDKRINKVFKKATRETV